MEPGWAIAAILLGAAIFGSLRARRVVSETWGIPNRRSLAGALATVAAVVALLVLLPSLIGVVLGALVLGLGLYGSWRLRRV
ncbi:MAG: hypothetical protein ACXWXQ_07355 [Actinomycetota bacterium]